MKIAVLILNYNCPQALLQKCLNSVYSQIYKDFSVFFIDNHSEPSPIPVLKKQFPQTNFIRHPRNLGVGAGFNPIIKKLIPDFDALMFVSPDAYLDKNCLSYLVNNLKSQPQADIVNCLAYRRNRSQLDSCGGTITNLPLGIWSGYQPQPLPEKPFPVLYAIITAMMVRSSAFKTHGLFNQSFFIYFEEIEFSLRLKLANRQILTQPKAVAFHHGHASKTNSRLANRIRGLAETNLLATYYLIFSLPTLILLLPMVFISRICLSFIYLFTSPLITLSKLKGIFRFIRYLLANHYQSQRKLNQQHRKISDYKLISQNSTSLFSVKPLMASLKPWLTTIKNNA